MGTREKTGFFHSKEVSSQNSNGRQEKGMKREEKPGTEGTVHLLLPFISWREGFLFISK